MSTCKCKERTVRFSGCHSVCTDYIEWKKQINEAKHADIESRVAERYATVINNRIHRHYLRRK